MEFLGLVPRQVLNNLVMSSDVGGFGRTCLQTVPNSSLEEFWLPLTSFNVDASSKSGCRVF